MTTDRIERDQLGAAIASYAVLLLPATLTVALSFNAGSYFPGTTALAAALVAVAAVACLALARQPFSGISVGGMIVAGAMALFAGWTLLSSQWSHAPARALFSYDRVLVYALTFAIFASMRRTEERVRTLLYGVGAGIVVVCTSSLISRMLPHLIAPTVSTDPHRLSFPLTYWNGLGLLAGVGLIFAIHCTASEREPWPARMLAAAAAPVLLCTLLLTLSRGAVYTTVVGILAYVALTRSWGLVAAALAAGPPCLLAFAVINPPSSLTNDLGTPAMIVRGQHQAIGVLGCVLLAACLRAALLPVDRRLARIHVRRRPKRIALATVGTTALVAVVALTASGVLANTARSAIAQFKRAGVAGEVGSTNRLLSVSNDGRIALWHVALNEFSRTPLHGSGAGTYEIEWDAHRPDPSNRLNAHSLYLETLGELGWVGLVLLATALIGIAVGAGRLLRGPARPLYAAVVAATLTWALASALDWDWQMPAITLWVFAAGGLLLARPAGPGAALRRWRAWLRWPALVAAALITLVPLNIVGAEGHVDRAVKAADAADCTRANAEAQAAVQAIPSLPQPAIVNAYCAVLDGTPRSAIAPVGHALAADPNNWKLWYDLGVVRALSGLSSASQLDTAHRLNPLDPNVLRALGIAPPRPLRFLLEHPHARRRRPPILVPLNPSA